MKEEKLKDERRMMNNGLSHLSLFIIQYSLFIIYHTDYQAGFIKLTKRALVYYLILAITLPSIILSSLFIFPKTAVGTCTGSANTAWKDGVTGKLNYSLDFDGTDDYVSVADNNTLDLTTDFTLSAWVYPTSTNGTTSNKGIIDKGANSYAVVYGGTSSPKNNGICFNKSGVNYDVCSSNTLTVNSWNHFVVTSGRKVYINGVDVSSAQSAQTYSANSSALLVGSRYSAGSDEYFPGQIDDVRVYNYALTATQVKELYGGGAVRFGPSTGVP